MEPRYKGSPPRLLGSDPKSGPCWLSKWHGKKARSNRVPRAATHCEPMLEISTNSEGTCTHRHTTRATRQRSSPPEPVTGGLGGEKRARGCSASSGWRARYESETLHSRNRPALSSVTGKSPSLGEAQPVRLMRREGFLGGVSDTPVSASNRSRCVQARGAWHVGNVGRAPAVTFQTVHIPSFN